MVRWRAADSQVQRRELVPGNYRYFEDKGAFYYYWLAVGNTRQRTAPEPVAPQADRRRGRGAVPLVLAPLTPGRRAPEPWHPAPYLPPGPLAPFSQPVRAAPDYII